MTALDDEAWFEHLPVPAPNGHKHDRGHAVVLAGPRHATGAARLAAGAALRAGAGLVTVLATPQAADIVAAHATAVMVRRLDENGVFGALRALEPAVVALGPGMAPNERTREAVRAALAHDAPCVLDAGALTAFASDPDALCAAIRARAAPVVLTPHGGEYARVFGDAALGDAVERSGAVIVLKGPDTRVRDPDGRERTITQAPPWLATAGTGDVLCGVIAGLAAQGMAPFEAAVAAVRIHAEAALRLGPAMTADDMDRALREVLGPLLQRRMGLAAGA